MDNQTNKNPKCWVHRHMSRADYGTYNVVKAWAYQKNAKVKGTLFFDGHRIANEFSVGGKTAVYEFRDRMIEEGWLISLDAPRIDTKTGEKIPKRNRKNGKMSSGRYRLLTHEQWAVEHPNACTLCRAVASPLEDEVEDEVCPVRPEGLDDEESSPPRGTGPVRFGDSPVRPEGLVQSALETHQSAQRDITGIELVIPTGVETGKEEPVSPQAAFPKLPISMVGPLKESEADNGRSASPPRGTGPVRPEGLDNVTAKPVVEVYIASLLKQSGPNMWQEAHRFYKERTKAGKTTTVPDIELFLEKGMMAFA